jgi:hypothetical protein
MKAIFLTYFDILWKVCQISANSSRFHYFCVLCVCIPKKKKHRMKANWKQEGNKKVGLKISTYRNEYVCVHVMSPEHGIES